MRTIPNSPITITDFGFTGQRNLDGTGLMDYRARFYSQSLGRFIQPDSIIPNLSNPQGWNRYSYVMNRPTGLTDPSGHRCVGDLEECLEDDGTTGPGFPGGGNGGEDDSNDEIGVMINNGFSEYEGSTFNCNGNPTCVINTISQLMGQGYSSWEIVMLLEIYFGGGSIGQYGVDYIIANGIHIKVGSHLDPRGWFGAGAWYTADASTIVLNLWEGYQEGTMPDPWGLSLIIHEAKHIEQGPLIAFSQFGEFQAWRIGLTVAQDLGYARTTGLGGRDRGVMSAASVEAFASVIREEDKSYWVGLSMLPTYPDPSWLGFVILPGP